MATVAVVDLILRVINVIVLLDDRYPWGFAIGDRATGVRIDTPAEKGGGDKGAREQGHSIAEEEFEVHGRGWFVSGD